MLRFSSVLQWRDVQQGIWIKDMVPFRRCSSQDSLHYQWTIILCEWCWILLWMKSRGSSRNDASFCLNLISSKIWVCVSTHCSVMKKLYRELRNVSQSFCKLVLVAPERVFQQSSALSFEVCHIGRFTENIYQQIHQEMKKCESGCPGQLDLLTLFSFLDRFTQKIYQYIGS